MITALFFLNIIFGNENQVLGIIRNILGNEEAPALWLVFILMVKIRAHMIDQLKKSIRINLKQTGMLFSTFKGIEKSKHAIGEIDGNCL